MSTEGYRPDIDGLRAVSVAAVIVFHLAPAAVRGGFIGVDVFFVLSGYLITRMVVRQQSEGGFRYRAFFGRRVRRLAPALLFMTLCTAVPAYFLLYPEDMLAYAKSVVSQFVAMQNMQFLAEGEYFRGADTKPLLHTWSLGVEEQFYLVWPWLLWLLRKRTHLHRLIAFGVIVAGSFAFALLCQRVSPKLAFFALPGRAWQLVLGGFLGVWEMNRPPRQASGSALSYWRAARGLGVLALLVSFVVFDGSRSWPDTRAVVPVLATLVIIAAGGRAADTWLAARPLVHVGKISYSLYLWHWPLIVFARHAGFDPESLVVAVPLVAASFVCAELSYRFVEEPIRRKRRLSTTRGLALGLASVALIAVTASVFTIRGDGAAFRYRGVERALLTAYAGAPNGRCGLVFRTLNPVAPTCRFDTPDSPRRVLLWGNSHAEMWIDLFQRLGQEESAEVYLSARNCPPVPSIDFCDQVIEPTLADVRDRGITDVVIAFTWYAYADADEPGAFEDALEHVVGRIAETGAVPWLMIDVPSSREFDPLRRLEAGGGQPTFGVFDRARFEARQRGPQMALARRIQASVVTARILDPTPAYCDAERCYGGRDGRALYRDVNHLSAEGAEAASEIMRVVFERELPATGSPTR